jgi:hypothetical protein
MKQAPTRAAQMGRRIANPAQDSAWEVSYLENISRPKDRCAVTAQDRAKSLNSWIVAPPEVTFRLVAI